MEAEVSGSQMDCTGGAAEAAGDQILNRKPAADLPRAVRVMWFPAGTRALLPVVLLVFLMLSGCNSCPPAAARVAPPVAVLRGATGGGRAPRFFRARVQHHTHSSSTWNISRVIISGDVELNPGPARSGVVDSSPTPVRTAPGTVNRQLSCLTQNVRSLKNEFSTLRAVSPVLERHDMVAFTETWLKPQVGDSELSHGFRNHVWFRRDRETETSGGGVACAVRSSLLPTRRSEAEPVGAEVLVIDLVGLCPAMTVVVAYRPPEDGSSLGKIVHALDTVCVGGRPVLLLGDFNLPEIVWKGADNHPELQRRTARALTLCEMIDHHGLRQHVTEPTREGAMLDLVISNLQHCQCDVDVGLFESEHRQTVVTFSVSCPSPTRITRSTALNYRRADFPGMRNSLRLLPWNVLDGLDVDDAVGIFYQWVEAAIADFIPTVILRSKVPPWFDGDVKRALREKESAHRQKKKSPTAENLAIFLTAGPDLRTLSHPSTVSTSYI